MKKQKMPTEDPIKILIIDDDEVDRLMVHRSLKQSEIQAKIVEATTAKEAIEILRSEVFQCIFLDYRLPDKDGLVLIQELKSLEVDAPLIVLTGQGDERIAVEIMKAGASDYVSKARVSAETLSQTFRNAMRVYQAEREVQKANDELRKKNEILKYKNEELERKQKQIALQNQELQESSRLKSQFLATISHELRTPMNAIMGFSQMLLSQYPDPLTQQQMDMVYRIYNNGQNLLNMINEVLDFSKIEAGKFILNLEKFNLVNLATLTIEELRSLAQVKNITLQSNFNLRDPLIISDSNCLKRVIVNLVSNSIKFTDVGGIEVHIWEVTSQEIAIAIKDTGIGISPEEIPHVFEAFRQGDQNLTRKHAGTGLGLAITDSLSKMIQGNITVESQLGKGSQFTVKIPRQIDQKSNHDEL